jgi:ABC-type phosphate transport system substrate-binding protein
MMGRLRYTDDWGLGGQGMAGSRRLWLGPPKARRLISVLVSTLLISLLGFVALPITKADAVTAVQIAGTGSTFADPAVVAWADQLAQAPYNISVDYTSSPPKVYTSSRTGQSTMRCRTPHM